MERGLIVNMYMAPPRRQGILLAHVEAPPPERDRGTRDAAQRHLLRHETVRFVKAKTNKNDGETNQSCRHDRFLILPEKRGAERKRTQW